MAALNFPANPNNGDTYEGYVWSDTVGAWQVIDPYSQDIADLQSDVADRVIKNNRSGQYFTITGERNGDITAGQYWAWGNGASTNEWPVLYDCVIVGAALWSEPGSTGTIGAQMQVNGTAQGSGSAISVIGSAGHNLSTSTFATPVTLSAGDRFTPVCISNSGISTGSTISLIGYWV